MISTIFGLLIGLFVVRYREIFFGMLNLAFSMVLWSLLEKFFHHHQRRRRHPRRASDRSAARSRREDFQYVLLYLTLALALIVRPGCSAISDSPLGHMLRAIKSNETRLEYLGVSAQRVLLFGYVVSAALGGLGGVLVAVAQQIATPEFAFWTKSGEFVFIAILGGSAHALGAFAGAAVFEFVRVFASAQLANAWQLILGVVLIVIIMFAPDGLIGCRPQECKARGDVSRESLSKRVD